MKVYGDLVAAAAETLASDPGGSVTGRFWWNSTDLRLMLDDGTNKRALFRNDQKIILGNNGTAANNVRLNRAANAVLQLVIGSDSTAEGSLSTSLAQFSSRIENYTDGTRPAFGNAGRVIYNTTVNALQLDTGSAWTTLGGSGGAGNLTSFTLDEYLAPEDIKISGVPFLRYDYLDQKSVFIKIKVPDNYKAGKQISLIDGVFKVNSTDNTKDILFRTATYLVKNSGATMAALSGTPHVSTNTEVAPGATANFGLEIGDLELTSSIGEVNSVAVAPGDILIVRLYRDFANETAPFQGDADLVKDDFNLRLETP